jgi:dGTPase
VAVDQTSGAQTVTRESRDARRLTEPSKQYEFRTPAQRDRDRILHSSAFRRLSGVTQVVSAHEESHLLHNRLTHSIKVAQVARRLAEKLCAEQADVVQAVGGVDPDVVEAAALAHDLGHPPFGHVGEQQLDECARPYVSDAFEGNAQSFRIVSKISVRNTTYVGLNLTRATLNALLKYPWLRGTGRTKQERKWSVYQSEEEDFRFAREGRAAGDVRKCPEAEIMDWADDIAYSVHDVEDFYRMGLIPLDKLTRDVKERELFVNRVIERHERKEIRTGFSPAQLQDAFREVISLFPEAPYEVSTGARAQLRTFTSNMIAQYVAAFQLRIPQNSSEDFAVIEDQARKEVAILKELTWHYVIHNPALATQQHGFRTIVRVLFEILFESATKDNLNVFPPMFREALQSELQTHLSGPTEARHAAVARIILDVISSMTEQQALRMFGRLTGGSPGSVLDPLYY